MANVSNDYIIFNFISVFKTLFIYKRQINKRQRQELQSNQSTLDR